MMKTEQMMSFVEAQSGETEEEEEQEEGGQVISDKDEVESTVGCEKEEEEAATQTATDEKIPSSVQAAGKKQQANVLILNNEVVKMRKEVKRIRALIIRKLARQIAVLKKKKGKETEIERNQKRAARLVEEIHCMKNLSPDLVTKTALQKNLSFEKICKNPKSTLSDRAVARIASHPQFNKKIESIKAAVKAFKEERAKSGKQERKVKVQKQSEKETVSSPDKMVKVENKKNRQDHSVWPQKMADGEKGEADLKDIDIATAVKGEKEDHSDDVLMQKISKPVSVEPVSVKGRQVKELKSNEPQNKAPKMDPSLLLAPDVLQQPADDVESDVESSDNEEKEYFDDSTEERFHKQSSHSEESDDDDFFIGKVSKFKKKKNKQKDGDGEKKPDEAHKVKKDPEDNVKTSDKLQNELDELEARLKSKATALQSVFCSSLARSKSGGGSARGRGGGKFRGQGKPRGGSSDKHFSNQPEFHEKGTLESKNSKTFPESNHPETDGKSSAFVGRGSGRGRGDVRGQKGYRGRGVFSHQVPQQALHPSWEASKRRKQEQGQILAFQGKKIKFDDDD